MSSGGRGRVLQWDEQRRQSKSLRAGMGAPHHLWKSASTNQKSATRANTIAVPFPATIQGAHLPVAAPES